jgi:hypothetical protein
LSRSPSYAVLTLALFALTALAAGCGGGGSSTEDFRAEVDETCTDQVAQFVDVEERLGTPISLEEAAKSQREMNPIRAESLEELEEVEAPDDLADDWERYLVIRRELSDLRAEELKLLEEGDQKAVEPLGDEIDERNEELEAQARTLGLQACARILPEDQRTEAIELVEEVSFTTDPELVCRDLVTENYLELGFGGSYEDCAEFQRENAEKFATDVEVESVEGVADTQAIVAITDVDGMFAGEESTWNLVREGEEWKVTAITAG